jgi:non-specific serine/threonine protein kinase
MPPEQAIEYALIEELPTTAAPSLLARREREVALLVARGLTNQQIAAELGMSVRTADTHVGRILKKLGCASRSAVTAWARDQHLPEAPSG